MGKTSPRGDAKERKPARMADFQSSDIETAAPPPTLAEPTSAPPAEIAEPLSSPPEPGGDDLIGGSSWWNDSFGLTICGKRLSNAGAKQVIGGLIGVVVLMAIVMAVAFTGGSDKPTTVASTPPARRPPPGPTPSVMTGGGKTTDTPPPPPPPAPGGELSHTSCDDPPQAANGEWTKSPFGVYTDGLEIQLVCNDDFVNSDRNSVRMTCRNGQWSIPGRFTPSCVRNRPSPPPPWVRPPPPPPGPTVESCQVVSNEAACADADLEGDWKMDCKWCGRVCVKRT